MKRYFHIFIFSIICLVACKDLIIQDGPSITDPDKEEIIVNPIICTTWGTSSSDVTNSMNEATIYRQEGNYITFQDCKNKNVYYVYCFNNDALCALMLISAGKRINTESFVEGMEYLGEFEEKPTYMNQSKNLTIICGVKDDTYWYVDFMPIESDLLQLPDPILAVTGIAEEITSDSAQVSGEVSGAKPGSHYGVVYGLNKNSIYAEGIRIEASQSPFTITLTNLEYCKEYCYCTFANEDGEDSFGDILTFKTPRPLSGTHNGHEWVDLGLPSGTLWATTNIGAKKPEDCGGYYEWAVSHEISIAENYAFYLGVVYGGGSSWDYVGLDISNSNYDTATKNWGEGWHMPTQKQVDELIREYFYGKREVLSIGGTTGAKLTGRNGNSIFFPFGGYKFRGDGKLEVSDNQEQGLYWTSSSKNGYAHSPYYFNLYQNGDTIKNEWPGHLGFLIRPVLELD